MDTEKDKVIKFKDFLLKRIYTDEEIRKADSNKVKSQMRDWNRLVKLVTKEFNKIFK